MPWRLTAVFGVAVEETSNAMALDGIMFEGVSVRVRRPTDYNPVAAAILGPSEPNPSLNVQAIGLQPGGSGMVSTSSLTHTVLHSKALMQTASS